MWMGAAAERRRRRGIEESEADVVGPWAQLGTLPIGVDLGASGAKLLQLRHGRGGFSVVHAARVSLPGVDEGADDPARLDALAKAVGSRVSAGGFRGRRCVVSVDDALVRTRSVRNPPMPDAEVTRAVRFDAPARLGFSTGEGCEIGWLRAGELRQGEDSREELIYVGAPRAPLERLVFALSEAGLRPMAIEPSFVACARCFGRKLRRASDASVARVVVDIGLRSTGVILTRGCGIAFYKPLEFGGEAMTRAAAERLGLEPDTVADLRRQRMLREAGADIPVNPKVDRALFDAVRPLMGELAHEVKLCLRYYSVTFKGSRPEACLVVGGDAQEPRLASFIGEALHVETSVGRPLEGMVVPGGCGVDQRLQGAAWSSAAGLSLRPWDEATAKRARRGRRRGDPKEPAAGTARERAA